MERKFTFKKRPIDHIPPPVAISPFVNRSTTTVVSQLGGTRPLPAAVLSNVSNYQPPPPPPVQQPSKLHLAQNPSFKKIEPMVKTTTSTPPPKPHAQPPPVHSFFEKKHHQPAVKNEEYLELDDDDYGFNRKPSSLQKPVASQFSQSVPKVKQQFQPLFPSSAANTIKLSPAAKPLPAPRANPVELKKSLENQYSRLDANSHGNEKYSLLSTLEEIETSDPPQRRKLHTDVELAKSIMALKSTNIDFNRQRKSNGSEKSLNDEESESSMISYSPQIGESSKKKVTNNSNGDGENEFEMAPLGVKKVFKSNKSSCNLVPTKVTNDESQEEDDFISSLLNDDEDDFARIKTSTTTPPSMTKKKNSSEPQRAVLMSSAEDSSSRSSSPVLLKAKKPETKRKDLVIVDSD